MPPTSSEVASGTAGAGVAAGGESDGAACGRGGLHRGRSDAGGGADDHRESRGRGTPEQERPTLDARGTRCRRRDGDGCLPAPQSSDQDPQDDDRRGDAEDRRCAVPGAAARAGGDGEQGQHPACREHEGPERWPSPFEHPGTGADGGDEDAHQDEEGHLVARAEQGDHDVLGAAGREVDHGGPHGDERTARAAEQQRPEFGGREEGSAGDESAAGGDEERSARTRRERPRRGTVVGRGCGRVVGGHEPSVGLPGRAPADSGEPVDEHHEGPAVEDGFGARSPHPASRRATGRARIGVC